MTAGGVSTETAEGRSGRAFRALTAFFLLVSLVVLGYGLLHKSSEPEFLGRYSGPYLILLACVAVVALVLGYLLWRRPPRLVRCAMNFYTFFISSLIALFLAEVGLRIFKPWGIELFHTLPYHMQGMVDHPRLGYFHPKSVSYELGDNLVVLNSHGLRDEEISYAKPPGEKRILALGDSVTFGWGVSQGESFADRMEPLLRARTGERWQVINAGVNGYNSQQEARFLRIEGMRYSPDIVVLLYVANDVDAVFDPNATTWRRYPTWPSSLPQLLERLRSLSYLYQLTKLFSRMEKVDADGAQSGDEQSAGRAANITSHPGWQASFVALKDMAKQCRDAGVRFLVVKRSASDPAWFAALEGAGIETMTLAAAYDEVPVAQHSVSRIDPHPSAAVHATFARYLVKGLEKRGWLGP